MNFIEIRPSLKFKGAWSAFEFSGVEPGQARSKRQFARMLGEIVTQGCDNAKIF